MGLGINLPPQEVAPHFCFLTVLGDLYPVAEDRYRRNAGHGPWLLPQASWSSCTHLLTYKTRMMPPYSFTP